MVNFLMKNKNVFDFEFILKLKIYIEKSYLKYCCYDLI